MDKKMSIIIAAAIIGIILLSVVIIDTSPATESMDDSYDGEGGTSSISGSVNAFAKIVDQVSNVIWSSQDDRYDIPESVVEPESGKEAVNFIMGIRYQASGTNIDWSSMNVTARWQVASYNSPNGVKGYWDYWDDMNILAAQNGDLESTTIALDPLVPESMTMVYWLYEDGRKIPITETFEERSVESHPFQLTFYGHYYVEVYDSYGHLYEQYYRQKVIIDLQWVGSDLNIEWSDPEDDTTVPSGTEPTLNSIADFLAIQGDVKDLSWNWMDIDGDLQSYTVSVNGIVVTDQSFAAGTSGETGTIDWAHKFTQLGENFVRITVTDIQGNTATDEVVVTCISGIDPEDNIGANDPDDPEAPVDPVMTVPLEPIRDVGAEQEFDSGDDLTTPSLSLFGGAGNTQVLVLLAVVAGTFLFLFNRKKR